MDAEEVKEAQCVSSGWRRERHPARKTPEPLVSRVQPANPRLPGKWPFNTTCVCVWFTFILRVASFLLPDFISLAMASECFSRGISCARRFSVYNFSFFVSFLFSALCTHYGVMPGFTGMAYLAACASRDETSPGTTTCTLW